MLQAYQRVVVGAKGKEGDTPFGENSAYNVEDAVPRRKLAQAGGVAPPLPIYIIYPKGCERGPTQIYMQ